MGTCTSTELKEGTPSCTSTHFSDSKKSTHFNFILQLQRSPMGMMNRKVKFTEPIQQAGIRNLLSSLDPAIPNFVILMLKTHVIESFKLVIPLGISSRYMPNEDIEVTLLDEKGEEQIVDYRDFRNTLGGRGWKEFVMKHKLAIGDAVIFQIMESNKFKVGNVRTTGLAEVDGAFGHLHPEACAWKSSLGKVGNDMKPKRKTVSGKPKCLHSSVIEGENENISPPQSVIDQPENCSEKTHLDYLKGISLARLVPEFEDIKNLESFTIIYNDLILDLVISAYTRSRYYELCCSQKSFLHKTLLPGLNFHIAVGLINETVNIADAIKSSQVSGTSMDKFQVWKKSLKASKGYGMNVGFLLRLLKELMKMASESEQAVDLSESKKSSKSEKEIISSRTVKKKKKNAVVLMKWCREAIVE
ncbi:hypothetical protein MKW92_031491 [Papaver armeniacum]|nr:hypothetical protein MKW92_031491 [Papaver armeniacum]